MKKKTEIELIDPINGVTPNQLFSQAEYLATTIPASKNLSKEELTDSISNTVLYILKKMEENLVPKFQYKDFKDYFFITLKNEISKAFKKRKHNVRNPIGNSIDIDDNDLFYVEENNSKQFEKQYQNKVEIIKKAMKYLSKKDQSIIYSVLNGKQINQACAEQNIYKSYYFNVIFKLKRIIKKIEKNNYNFIPMERSKYYSQTDVTNTFKIGIKGIKKLVKDHQIPVLVKDVNLGLFEVKGLYIEKEYIDKLNLEKR